MAKRVAAQRRGLLYGLIGMIGLSIILAVLFFLQLSKTQNLLRLYDPKADELVDVENDLKNVQRDMAALGVLPSATGQMSLKEAINKLKKQNEKYKQGIDRLAYQISQQSSSGAVDEQLMNFVQGQIEIAEASRDTAKAALSVVPQLADVKDVEVVEPTSLQSAITSMKTHIEALVETYKTKQSDLQKLVANNNSLESQLQSTGMALNTKFDEMVIAKDKEITALQGKITEVQAESDSREQQREALKDEFITHKQETAKKLQEKVNRINEQDSQIKELITQVDRATTGVAQPDGVVVSVMPGNETAYINLTAGDGVFSNLGFGVYGPHDVGEGKQKAYVRIVNVMENACEVRIESYRKTDPVVKGDVVVNIAWDRDRRFHFGVIGRFDINGDGQDDSALIKHLIERFGGKVDDKLNVRSDYLVVGDDPMAGFVMTGTMTPQQQVIWNGLKEEQKAYGEASELARRFWIPVLNQNRFLTLVGRQPLEAE